MWVLLNNMPLPLRWNGNRRLQALCRNLFNFFTKSLRSSGSRRSITIITVRFAIDRAGLVGADGPSHAGSFDITYLSTSKFYSYGSSDEAELVKMINTSVNINDRPSAFRYPRGNGIGVNLPLLKKL